MRVFDEAGFPDIVGRSRGGLSLDISQIDCDYYRLLDGDQKAIDSYNGEYMSQFSWAELTNGELWHKYRE